MAKRMNPILIFRISILILCIALFNNCSGANFDGGGGDERSATIQPTRTGTDPVDSPTPSPTPSEPTPTSQDYLVFQTRLLDSALSFDEQSVTINITPQTQEVLLFIHTHSPVVVTLTGDTDAIAGLFITASSSLSTSSVKLEDGTPFPTSITATGFYPNYSAGSELLDVIGVDDINTWNSGVAVETFAKSQGPNKCFYFEYDSDIDPTNWFNLSWPSGLDCIL